MAREALLRLGSGADSWAFVGPALRFLDDAPEDAEIRAVLSARLASLGLTTLAREQFERLPAVWSEHADMAPLRTAVRIPARDPVAHDALIAVCRANVDALLARGVDVRGAFDEWVALARGREYFRGRDGNVVRREAGRSDSGAYEHAWDTRSEAALAKIELPDANDAAANAAPIVLEGVDPPWMLLRLFEQTPTLRNGQRTRIDVVQADALELLDGLALADLRAAIGDDRTRWWVGPDATEGLAASLDERLGAIIVGHAIRLPSLRTAAQPAIERTLEAGAERQTREHERLRVRINAFSGSRGVAYWRERFDEALSGRGKPLRVLLPTCRYSTFVRHSAEDMAEAVRAAGHEALVLIEPDDCSRFSTVAYLRAFDDFQPDLVILINYTRANLGAAMAPGVPFVCWIQDAMPHLFDEKIGAAQGPLDFVAGYAPVGLCGAFGYLKDRILRTPVTASARKFHGGAVDEHRRGRYLCEVAYVGHQSEAPEALHERMVNASRASVVAVRAMEALRPRALEIAGSAMNGSPNHRLRLAATEALRNATGAEPDERALATLLHQYALPLADRAFRHEALGWAAEIARGRGWRFRIHGRGWERHPTLREFASGEVAHGEDLRACYQSAAAHLHVSINNVLHQRVLECALSGGLPLCRLHHDEVWAAEAAIMSVVTREQPPAQHRLATKCDEWNVVDHALLLRFASLRQRLGLPAFMAQSMHGALRRAIDLGEARVIEQTAAFALGDLAETTFQSKDSLERLLTRAVERPQWRESASRMISRRAAEHLTYDAAMRRMIAWIRDVLADSASA